MVRRGVVGWADDCQDPPAVDSQPAENGRVRLEVGEVVVLLEAGVPAEVRRRCAEFAQPIDWDRVWDQHPACDSEADSALQAGELVVLHLHGRHPQDRADDGEVDRPVGKGEAEPSLARPEAEARAAAHQSAGLAEGRGAPVAVDDLVGDPEPIKRGLGLAEPACGHDDLVRRRPQQRNDRA